MAPFTLKEELSGLVGKTINWKAPIYKHNLGHFGYGLDGGKCIINKVDDTQRRPIIDITIIEGADLRFAFITSDGVLAYSDSDRLVQIDEN